MSVLFSYENCLLISHEQFINRIYDGCTSSDSEQIGYKINSDLFDLNVPYRYKTPDDAEREKRQRKIINKTTAKVADEQRDEFELVLFDLFLLSQHYFEGKIFISFTD